MEPPPVQRLRGACPHLLCSLALWGYQPPPAFVAHWDLEFLQILCSFCGYLHSPELCDAARLHLTAFRRQRKLPFPKLLTLMLAGMTASVQQELDRLSGVLQGSTELLSEVSAQAFSKARKGFSAQVFRLLNQTLLGLVETHLPVPRWRGFRIVAGDASKLQLFLKDATSRKVREAIAFMLYLPGLELALAFELYPPSVGERQMRFEHLQSLQQDDLLVLDRGYPSRWLVAVLLHLGIPFCIRVDDTGFAAVKQFRRSAAAQAIVTLGPPSEAEAADYGCPRQPSIVRLILVVTPNGKRHVVMTSLLDDAAHPAAEFADLYHARWRIEEAFKRIKHRLALEQLSGISWLAAQQDFGAKVLCDNLNALAVYAAAPEPIRRHGHTSRVYKINRTYGFAALKRCLPRWLLLQLPSLPDLARLFQQLLKNLVGYVPGASKPRPKGHKPHRHSAYKSIT